MKSPLIMKDFGDSRVWYHPTMLPSCNRDDEARLMRYVLGGRRFSMGYVQSPGFQGMCLNHGGL